VAPPPLRRRGEYDYAQERLWRPRPYEGVPGVALLTPIKLADGSAVLVDRGWAPSPDAYHVDQRAYREPDTADVVGIGMAAPRARGDVDPAKLRDSLPYPLLPFVIQLLPPSTNLRRPPQPALVCMPPPELSDGPHLSYAIQWFSFAVIIVVGSAALVRKQRRQADLSCCPPPPTSAGLHNLPSSVCPLPSSPTVPTCPTRSSGSASP